MFLSSVFNRLKGFVTIKVFGKKAERLINIAMERNVPVWNVRRKKDYLIMNLSIDGYKELWFVCRKLHIPIRIVKKKGGPFLLHKLCRRKVFAIGLILFILTLYILSSFIWFVNVEGLETIDPQEFNEFIHEQDLKRGTFKYSIDTDHLEHQLKLRFKEMAWVSVNVTGTQVLVEVVEKDPAEVTEKGPSNIIAAKDGVITKILVLSGQREVEVGQTVAKNQILVTGQMFNEESRTHMLVRSFGIIEGKVWYEGYGEALPRETNYEETGNTSEVKYINLFGKRIRISKKDIPFEKYSRKESIQSLRIRTSRVPVELITHTYYEVKGKEVNYSTNEMERLARDRAVANAETKVPEGVEIVNKTVNILERTDKIVRIKVILETIEEIGKIQRINN